MCQRRWSSSRKSLISVFTERFVCLQDCFEIARQDYWDNHEIPPDDTWYTKIRDKLFPQDPPIEAFVDREVRLQKEAKALKEK